MLNSSQKTGRREVTCSFRGRVNITHTAAIVLFLISLVSPLFAGDAKGGEIQGASRNPGSNLVHAGSFAGPLNGNASGNAWTVNAVSDAKIISGDNCGMTSGNNILRCASPHFYPGDTGRKMAVNGAGAAAGYLMTTIIGQMNGTTVKLADNASTTVSNALITWGTDASSAIQAALSHAGNLAFLPGGKYLIASTLVLPVGVTFSGASSGTSGSGIHTPSELVQYGTTDVIDMTAGKNTIQNLFILGSKGKSGRGIVIMGGQFQRIFDVDCVDTGGYCLEMDGIGAGSNLLMRGGIWHTATPSTLEAIKFPSQRESNVGVGHRVFEDVNGSGKLIDLGNSENTQVIGCHFSTVTYHDGTAKANLIGNRIAGMSWGHPFHVKGTTHNIVGNSIANPVYLDKGLTASTFAGNTVVADPNPPYQRYYDNSGQVSNVISDVMDDITTNNVSASMHGFCPKLPNDPTKYLDGTGEWSRVRNTKGPVPALSHCGTTPSIIGNDVAGTITEGFSAAGCTITFHDAYPSVPSCVITSQGGLEFTYAVSASSITIINTEPLAGTKLNYLCLGVW